MAKTLYQLIRPFIPNVGLSIAHVEPDKKLKVRLRQHLGMIAKGAQHYESQYVRTLRALIADGDRVFDVGANIGFYSVLFSCWVGASGQVLAYEPDPDNAALLDGNVLVNNCENVVIRKHALGSTTGSEVFSVDAVTGSTGHLGRGPTYAGTIFGNGRELLVNVDVTTLDSEAERWGHPDLIKMDVEGGEFDVLSGGIATLENHRPLVVSELSAWGDDVSDSPRKAAFATKLLGDCDYWLWDLDARARIEPGDITWMILAVPQERANEDRIARVLSQFNG